MKYYHKNENIIASDLDLDLPEATYEEWQQYNLPTKEEQEQARANAYAEEIDPLHARKARKTILGEWTEEDEAEYVTKVKELSAEIAERYPYPTDPITKGEENGKTEM